MRGLERRRRRDLEPPRTLLGGLVDINSAPAAELARLPGLDDDLAAMIVLLRGHMDGFASLAQLGLMLDLPADVLSDLSDCTVMLP
jgi:DNA uptake protein ComE-like DNA-binding protein